VLQPVGGEVGVDARIIRDHREIDEENEPQCQGGQGGCQKKPAMFADQAEHVGNISHRVGEN